MKTIRFMVTTSYLNESAGNAVSDFLSLDEVLEQFEGSYVDEVLLNGSKRWRTSISHVSIEMF